MKGKEMKVFYINCTNLKYENTFKIDKLFSTREKAMAFVEKLDAIETRWDFDYDIREELVD
jgi:hypothetical protein